MQYKIRKACKNGLYISTRLYEYNDGDMLIGEMCASMKNIGATGTITAFI